MVRLGHDRYQYAPLGCSTVPMVRMMYTMSPITLQSCT